MSPTLPTLRSLCEGHFDAVLGQLDSGVATCVAQERACEERKTALLLELAATSDALEELYKCRMDLEETRESALERETHIFLLPLSTTKQASDEVLA